MRHVLGTPDKELFTEDAALEHPQSGEGSRRALPAPPGASSCFVLSPPGLLFSWWGSMSAFTRAEGTSGAAWHLKEGKTKMAEVLKNSVI